VAKENLDGLIAESCGKPVWLRSMERPICLFVHQSGLVCIGVAHFIEIAHRESAGIDVNGSACIVYPVAELFQSFVPILIVYTSATHSRYLEKSQLVTQLAL